MKDYEVRVRVRNNRILARIDITRFGSIAAFCRAHSLHYQAVVNLINLHDPAKGLRGEFRKHVVDLATALGVLPDELFTERQLAGFKQPSVVRHVDEADILPLDGPDALMLSDGSDLSKEVTDRAAVERALGVLAPRYADVVRRRFGLGVPEETVDEIAESQGVTGQMIQLILKKSFEKLRRPTGAKILRGHQ